MIAICILSLGSELGIISQFCALASHTHWIRGSMGPRVSLNMVLDIKFCPCWEPNILLIEEIYYVTLFISVKMVSI
jgi:hypothetical protein